MKSSRRKRQWPGLLALIAIIQFLEMNRHGCVAFQKLTGVLVPSAQSNLLPYRKSNVATPIFASPLTSETKRQLIPLLDFRRNETIDMIERLDDAIMGGISTSAVRQGEKYAIWSGVCRTDGGGFCGFRTNPFRNPLMLQATLSEQKLNGFYVQCRLASDNEADRRVWKLTTRTKPDRGELLYQAPIQLNPGATEYELPDWQTVYVPFDCFRLVRGPRIIENGLPLNVSKGIYQIGMSMSKFLFAAASNSTEKTLDNFRDGYFELHIQEIGAYATFGASNINGDSPSRAYVQISTMEMKPEPPLSVYSKLEVQRQRPLLVKFLFLLSKIFFSEQSQRRKAALRKLRSKWKMSRRQAIWWGFKRRLLVSTINHEKNKHFRLLYSAILSTKETLSILAIDSFRFALSAALKLFLFYPIKLLATVVRMFSRLYTKAPNAL